MEESSLSIGSVKLLIVFPKVANYGTSHIWSTKRGSVYYDRTNSIKLIWDWQNMVTSEEWSAGVQLATSPIARLQKIVSGYNDICFCSPAGYKKSDILRSYSVEYQEYDQLKDLTRQCSFSRVQN